VAIFDLVDSVGGFEALGDDEHDAIMDSYVKCDPDNFRATSGYFSNSLLTSNSGMLVTW